MESIIAEPKIHFYEFMEIEILHEYIQAGIEYMVKSFLNASQTLVSLRYFSHEIATFISALKDIYFLLRHKGLYAENFYGLERTNPRTKFTILFEVLIWVVGPYLSRKLEQKFNLLKQRQDSGIGLSLGAKVYLKVFPLCFCLLKVLSTVMKFRYLMETDAKFYNLRYLAAGTQLTYIEQANPSPFPIMSFLKSPGLFFILVAHKIASYSFSLEKKGKSKSELTSVEAPVKEKKKKQCPICGKRFKSPAVLRSSGYVFCYGCIVVEVRKEKRCPLSQVPSDQSQIQILYE